MGDHRCNAMVLLNKHIAVHGSTWLVRLLELELGSACLVGPGMKTFQQWDDTSGCLWQPTDA